MLQDASPTASVLRLIAFLGTGVILLWQVVSVPQLQPRQSAGFVVLALAVPAVGATLLILLPDAAERLLRHKDLLVPLGLFVTASTIFNALAALPALAALGLSWPVSVLTFSFSLSASLIVTALLSVVYVGWTTTLIFQAVVLGQVNLVGGITIIGRWFWRVLALGFFGWGVALVNMAVVLGVYAVSTTLALILLAATSLLLNLATAAVLPVALADTRPFWPALRHGLAVSRAGLRKWAPLLIAHMLLLGWVTFIHVSYTTYETKNAAEYTETTTRRTQTAWRVNGIWTGGYADGCKWQEDLMKALEAEPVQLIERLLTLLFSVLAIAIKIKIVSDVYRPASAHDAPSGDPLDSAPSGPAPFEAAV